jgi:hypothetical protein
MQRYLGKEQEEELTGVCTAAVERWRACREDPISPSNVLERKKTGGDVEGEAEEQ